jgi:hypothetical protein
VVSLRRLYPDVGLCVVVDLAPALAHEIITDHPVPAIADKMKAEGFR